MNNLLEQKQKQSLLIISHSYTPILNPRAFRWSSLAEQFVQQGMNVDVITAWQPELAREEILNGVNVFRVGGSIIEKVRNRLAPNDKKIKVSTGETRQPEKSQIRSALTWLHDNSWKKVYWPDYACLWKKPAARAAIHLLQREQYTHLISVSDPFTSHLAGQMVKQQYPHLYWMVDIGDPFCFRHDTPTNNHAIYNNHNYRTEKMIFDMADTISVTTESTRQKYAELFSASKEKISVIPPMMAAKTDLKTKDKNKNNQKVKMVFVGTLYKAIRNPSYLLSLFDKLMQTSLSKNVELHFYGGINDCKEEFRKYEQYFNKSLFLHGLVPREKVLEAIDQASVLINIGNDNEYQLPSKIVEYMVSGQPVINIVKLKNDSSVSFMKKYPASITLYDTNEHANDTQLTSSIQFLNSLPVRLSIKERQYWQSKFSVENISQQYVKLLSVPSKNMETVS